MVKLTLSLARLRGKKEKRKNMKICTICQKTLLMAGKHNKLRGKYNPVGKIKKYPNLQWITVPKDVSHKKFIPFAGKRIKVCAKCLKTLAKQPVK